MPYPIVPTVCPKPNWFDCYRSLKFDPIMWDHIKKKKTIKLKNGQTTICPQFYESPATHSIIFLLQLNDCLPQPTNAPSTTESPSG